MSELLSTFYALCGLVSTGFFTAVGAAWGLLWSHQAYERYADWKDPQRKAKRDEERGYL